MLTKNKAKTPLKFTFSIGKSETCNKSKKHIQSNDVKKTVEQYLYTKEIAKKDIVIMSSNSSFRDDLECALKNKVSIYNKDVFYKISTMHELQVASLQLECSVLDEDKIKPENKLIQAALKCSPIKFDEQTTISIATANSLSDSHSERVSKIIKKALKDRKAKVMLLCSIKEFAHKNKDLFEIIDAPYSAELAKEMANKSGTHLLIGEMGTCKSELVIKNFEKECIALGLHPILMSSSRALSRSYLDDEDDDSYYLNTLSSSTKTQSLVGVINTILLARRCKKVRELSRALVVDEIEEVFNHTSGDAVGEGLLADKAEINNRFDAQYIQSDVCLFSDAMMSVQTLKRLLGLNKQREHKKIYIYTQESKFKKKAVKVFDDEVMMIEEMRNKIRSGNKVAIFHDGKHGSNGSDLDKLIIQLNIEVNKNGKIIPKSKKEENWKFKTLVIDGAFMSSDDSVKIMNVDTLVDDYDIIIYNSAAKCGLSVTHKEFRDTYIFSCGTVSANELVQSAERFRLSDCINIFFKSHSRKTILNTKKIISEIVISESDDDVFEYGLADSISKKEGVQTVAERILHKNTMKADYANIVILIIEFLGYDIEYVRKSKDEPSGKSINTAAQNAELDMRKKLVISAVKVSKDKLDTLKKKNSHCSKLEKCILENAALRNFYKVDNVDEALFDFDSSGNGRRFISNFKLLRNETHATSAKNQIRKKMYDMFFELTGLSKDNVGTFKHSLIEFSQFMKNGEINYGKDNAVTMSAKEAFKIAFPRSNISTQSARVVKSVLELEFGIKKDRFSVKNNSNNVKETTTELSEEFNHYYLSSSN